MNLYSEELRKGFILRWHRVSGDYMVSAIKDGYESTMIMSNLEQAKKEAMSALQKFIDNGYTWETT